ncbi:MAG: imidazole glycerol phosphate synthase, glutamine amidotransferase subunit [Nitrospirae bacterium GWC2_46_6]|nr:MAG: imidazole glycerol phosphate synthase, glutamine amidotransferase subunit [Nitrospirae bacterium GWA2_46_11]OGW23034.1 MAG: imidazole glycerol phosphate synthase, glutamine amidotransferase subunit [Nitrospirae bacterium GWC2_46_6]OGW23698.1 MAG: imidazole glycerol phosphate synthase, glutamine amidotransferase subunit [Nitrospirae bacterium GWB2_47_37]HAK89192.1 imidazole glycerol phosphate synthase subunit HisH [Nitrospiraceae bacterium]HCZ11473.1 imidazole glycerol phosphate synthase
MIAIVDYGMGNIRSVEKGFAKVGADVKITSDPKVIADAEGIVLPGVGAFRDCMKNLDNLKLLDSIVKEIRKGKPYLGICLGLQILFTESEEFGVCKGLDVFNGKVVKFRFEKKERQDLKIPHMGWNTVKLVRRPPIFGGIPDNSYFYFVHSFYVVPAERAIAAGTTDYGIEFTSMVWKDNVFATQFHPEKSQELGLTILKGFKEFVTAQ